MSAGMSAATVLGCRAGWWGAGWDIDCDGGATIFVDTRVLEKSSAFGAGVWWYVSARHR